VVSAPGAPGGVPEARFMGGIGRGWRGEGIGGGTLPYGTGATGKERELAGSTAVRVPAAVETRPMRPGFRENGGARTLRLPLDDLIRTGKGSPARYHYRTGSREGGLDTNYTRNSTAMSDSVFPSASTDV